ncbi:hypothetical protein HK405_006084 [Cladochytrium tenue]|nr:hypothetical protein HK405_006084 [Cladochytrium tenue]
MPSWRSARTVREALARMPTLEVSSPHPKSMIRLIRHTNISSLESLAMREWREASIRTQEMHHRFWEAANTEYAACKKEFEDKVLAATGSPATADDVARFYRDYMARTRPRFAAYHAATVRQSFANLGPAARAYADYALGVVAAASTHLTDRSVVAAAVNRLFSRSAASNSYKYRAHGVSVR